MNEEQDKNAFDRLVAGLATDERKEMLARLNASNIQPMQIVSDSSPVDRFTGTLTLRLKQEGLLYRIMLKLRSLFTKTSVEKIYNEDVLYGLARKLNRNHPGLVSPNAKVLDSLFYDQLRKLKDAADFFKPYCRIVNDDAGSFYVFLSTFVAPEISDTINEQSDPYKLPDSKNPDKNVKVDLHRNLDNVLKDLKGESKQKLYGAAKAVQWLIAFSELPFIHFVAQFTDIKDGFYTCTYKSAQTDFSTFAAVFDDVYPVSNEVLEALFLFSQKRELAKKSFDSDVEKAVKGFLSKAASYFLTIRTFTSLVPMNTLGKIINDDYDWQPETIGGAENWFPKFKNHWHHIIDVRWNDWVKDKKKQALETSLLKDFQLEHFPELPNRPWTQLWGGVPFAHELTGGFIAWFSTMVFDSVMKNLNVVIMEGIFVRNETRTEFSSALEKFVRANNNMQNLLERLGDKGDLGQFFDKLLDGGVRTFQAQSSVESMIVQIESECREIKDDFCDSCRRLGVIFTGIFSENSSNSQFALQNLNAIRAHENARFRNSLKATGATLKHALYYLSELEPIELIGSEK